MSLSERTPRPGRIVVCVQRRPRGGWEVSSPGARSRVSCETFEDARRIAYLTVAHAHDCEVIVRDAYYRVVRHELIQGHGRPSKTQRPRPPS